MINQDKTLTFDGAKSLPFWERCLPSVYFTGNFASSSNCARHAHSVPELVLVTEGSCRIEVGRQWLEGCEGTLFVLPAHIPQFQRTLRFTRTLYLGFRADSDLFDTTARTLSLGLDDLAVRVTYELCRLKRHNQVVSGSLLLALLSHLRSVEAQETSRAQWHPGLKAAVNFIEERQCEPLQIMDISQHSCISASHLTSLFRHQFDCGPYQFQQRLRMDRACRLLTDLRYSIREVACECGYGDSNYFSRLFRRHFGVSPLAWRQQRLRERQ